MSWLNSLVVLGLTLPAAARFDRIERSIERGELRVNQSPILRRQNAQTGRAGRAWILAELLLEMSDQQIGVRHQFLSSSGPRHGVAV
jgi:hypothetical protein